MRKNTISSARVWHLLLESGYKVSERTRIALLLSLTLLVYANTLLNDFTMDDNLYILSNSSVTSGSIAKFFEPTKYNNVFRPVTFASFALNWLISGPKPFGYHLGNLLLHAAVVLLLYLVLLKLLEEERQGALIAWGAALLFAVHPIHTEAVASVSARSELLAAGFLLGAWLLHLNDRPILALISFVLALLSKESAVAFVPLVLVGDYACGKFKPVARYLTIGATTAVYLGLLWVVQGGRFGEKRVDFLDNPLAHLPATLRILNALRIAWKYIGLQVFPSKLSCDYSYNAITLHSNWRYGAIAAFGTLAVLVLWVWSISTGRRAWALAGGIYLSAFAVTANIVLPSGTIMGERLAYLPSAGFCLLLALMWMRFEKLNKRLLWVSFSVLLVLLSARTIARNLDWRNNLDLFSAAVRVVPGSAKMHSNLAIQYYLIDRIDDADREVHAGLRIYPDMPDGISCAALVAARRNHDAESRRLLEEALSKTAKENPNYDFIAVNLAAVEMKLGDNDSAAKLLDETIARSPKLSRAWSDRAAIRYQQGNFAAARADAAMALSLDLANRQAQNVLRLLSEPGGGLANP